MLPLRFVAGGVGSGPPSVVGARVAGALEQLGLCREQADRAGHPGVVEQRGQCRKTCLRSVGPPHRHGTVDPDDRRFVQPGQRGVQDLAAERDLGRLREDVDPTEAATLILVTLFGLTIVPSGPAALSAPPTIRRVVELLLEGLAP